MKTEKRLGQSLHTGKEKLAQIKVKTFLKNIVIKFQNLSKDIGKINNDKRPNFVRGMMHAVEAKAIETNWVEMPGPNLNLETVGLKKEVFCGTISKDASRYQQKDKRESTTEDKRNQTENNLTY